jgi:glucose-1-phosphate thymidylyltransferase
MLIKEHTNPSNFGVVTIKDGCITSIIEKPQHTPSFMVSTGIFSLTKNFFKFIKENDVTDAVSLMIKSGEKVKAIVADDWQDAIYPWDLLKMNSRLLKTLSPSREGDFSRLALIQGSVRIGKGTTISANTVIKGPVIIGNDCEIGPNCCIMPDTSIGSRVTIEPFTYLRNCLVMDDTTIGSHTRICDSVIGERCRLSDHTSTSTGGSLMEIEGVVIKPEFGAIIGDQVDGGSFALYSNSVIGNNVKVSPGYRIVSRILPDDTQVM